MIINCFLVFHLLMFVYADDHFTCIRDHRRDRPNVPEHIFQQITSSTSANDGNQTPDECFRPCDSSVKRTCHYTWVVEWFNTMSLACGNCPCNQTDCLQEECIAMDGVPRAIVVVNRQFPGPAIEVCLGDRIIVNVVNKMENGEGVSIHWHGILQRGTPHMDGVSLITQCPITPYSSFRYDFIADKAGTHFWHGHSGFSRNDGLYGAFIVRQPEPENYHHQLYDFDLPQHMMMVADWYHKTSAEEWTKASYRDMFDDQPPTILINDKGQFSIYVDSTTNNSHLTSREVFEVEKGLRYRFRIIGTGFKGASLQISIDNHTMSIIASDGSDVQPTEVDALVMYPGERYDVILHASQEVGNYWLKIINDEEPIIENQALAIIRYKGANEAVPQYTPTLGRQGKVYQKYNAPASPDVVIVSNLKAVENISLPQEEKTTIYMTAGHSPVADPQIGEEISVVNDRAFVATGYTLLTQHSDEENADEICDFHDEELDARCSNEFCRCTQVLQVELNQIVELFLINEKRPVPSIHPFHIHGYDFRVLAQEKFDSPKSKAEIIEMDQNGQIERNYDDPPLKDTVITTSPGYTIIQFVADNPGWWFFHCHTSLHLAEGMALVIRVGEQSDIPPIPTNFPRCGSFTDPEYLTPSTEVPTESPPDINPSPSQTQTVIIMAVVVGVLGFVILIQAFVLLYHSRGSADGHESGKPKSNNSSSHENRAYVS